MSERTINFNFNIDGVSFREGDGALSDIGDADLVRMVSGFSMGLVSDRSLAAIELSGIKLLVNGVNAQVLMDELKRRRLG